MRPGATPLATLVARLSQELGEVVPEEAAGLGRSAGAAARRAGVSILIFVDQLEELFTLCPDAAARTTFAAALASAAASVADPVRVVLAVRDDFLARVAQLEPCATGWRPA